MQSRIRDLLGRLYPAPSTWRGATIGLVVTGLIASTYSGVHARTGLGLFSDIALLVSAGLLLMLLVALLSWLFLGIVARLPPSFLAFAVAAVAALYLVMELPVSFAMMFAIPIVFVEAAFGGAIAATAGGRWNGASSWKKASLALVLLGSVAANATFAFWLAWPGFARETAEAPPVAVRTTVDAPNPSEPGNFEVGTLFYGSGDDRRRSEFGAKVDLKTDPVDATPLVSASGWKANLRESYWGFGLDRFPRNGRVWHPAGDGPFPLVLIVHGNDNMTEAADAGYGYLGELLASRGYIAVSVDECFFGTYFMAGGLGGENDARAWLLLKHLELWRDWNNVAGNPFSGRVDLSKVALIGHSRGGEAVAHAAAFNRLKHYPDDAMVEFDFDFDIRALVSIAPSDRQYEPAGKPTELEDVSFLLLQGAHDADVSYILGVRQFQRVTFSQLGPWFKSLLYIERANHSQFNTEWGRVDAGMPMGHLLNTAPLLDADEQREIARVYISAFLDVTLRGDDRFRSMFKDYRAISAWLPNTGYITRYQDPTFRLIADFEEDIDVTTCGLPGGTLRTTGLSTWREQDVPFRGGGSQQNQVARVGWGEEHDAETIAAGDQSAAGATAEERETNSDTRPSYEVQLPADHDLGITPDDVLVVDLMNASDDSVDDGPLDFTVVLADRVGAHVAIPLSRFQSLERPFEAVFTKLPALEPLTPLYTQPADFVLQTIELPLSDFVAINSQFDANQLARIRFAFDRSPVGTILIDNLGIRARE